MKDERLISMRVYLAVVETGGFTAAAQSLKVSQPFVSQTIQRLEERLKTKLLHRTTRGHRLTPEGEKFVEACRKAVEAIDAAEAILQTDSQSISGSLRVSTPIAFGLDRITPILPEFLDKHPKISLELVLTDDSVNLIEDQIDVAIRMGRLADSTLMHRRLCDLQRIIVASPDFIDRYGLPQTPEDLEHMPCLSWDHAHDHLNRWFFADNNNTSEVYANGRFRSNEGMSLFKMCMAGYGLMRCAEHLAMPAIRRGELVQVLESYTATDDTAVFAVFLPDRNMLPRIRFFIDYMIDTFRAPSW